MTLFLLFHEENESIVAVKEIVALILGRSMLCLLVLFFGSLNMNRGVFMDVEEAKMWAVLDDSNGIQDHPLLLTSALSCKGKLLEKHISKTLLKYGSH